jgi:hypothetical protein
MSIELKGEDTVSDHLSVYKPKEKVIEKPDGFDTFSEYGI